MAFDTDDFEKDVIARSYDVPVLVDFWAEWCGPCKVLGPVLERLAQRSAGEWELAKLDTDKHPAIAARYGIRSIPNVKLFVDGEVANEFVGALPERTVEEWLKNAVPSKYRAQLEGARQLLLEDRAGEAREMLRPVVAAEPENHQAAALLAQALFGSDPEEALRTVEPIRLGSDYYEVADAIRTLDAALDPHRRLASARGPGQGQLRPGVGRRPRRRFPGRARRPHRGRAEEQVLRR